MFIKFYKTIHNKFSRFFKFIFFLRYLFAIFFISIAIFLIIPNFLNYEKKIETIKSYLLKNYNIEILNYEKIRFESLFLPKIKIENVLINFDQSRNNLRVKSLKIYPKLFSIYNYKNFDSNKIDLKDNQISLEAPELKSFTNIFLKQKKKITLDNLELSISDKKKTIIKLKNIKFANFGYRENLITGTVFEKKFKIEIENDLKNIDFELLKSGVTASIDFNTKSKANLISGVLKSKILNTNFKFSFDYNDKKLKIYNSYLRNKNLILNGESLIVLKPFLDFNSKFNVEKINLQIFKKVNLNMLLSQKDIIKKINSKNELYFKSNKFSRNVLNGLNLKIDLAYGRLNYIKNFSINENFFQCKGNINFLEEYPLLFFDCSIISSDKKKLLKELSIKTKNSGPLNLKVKGNLSVVNKKINFKNILVNDVASTKEDLNYYKNTFENILLENSFIEIFNFKKVKEFVLEIS